ncbi:MAG: PocR ligand-binding domain-containing protein [Anaerolineae bacterium]|nr:PocR ligand-binding domain-containing protein [Thermoflexales bacterium]HQW35592.1 PocR ligand-binding domain-containing protein [Thermoflexales bacterium]
MAELLSTRDVVDLLQVDRTTIYRLVEDGKLPAIRIGKQWRFDRADLNHLMRGNGATPAQNPSAETAAPAARAITPKTHPLAKLLPLDTAQALQDTFADMLGVMIVITDMDGEPITHVSNPCGLYKAVLRDEASVGRCVRDWQRIAGHTSLEPKFLPNDLGLLCTRGLIRLGNELKGMVFIGGVMPDDWPPSEDEVTLMAVRFGVPREVIVTHIREGFSVDTSAREHILGFAQRMADVFSHMIEDRAK